LRVIELGLNRGDEFHPRAVSSFEVREERNVREKRRRWKGDTDMWIPWER
jgi:hypothetical protein